MQACGLQTTGAQINNFAAVSGGLEKRHPYQVCMVLSCILGQTECLVLVARRAIALEGSPPRAYRDILILWS